ncbi:MAG: hypothetical protein FWD79_11535 [Desulfobulbus sp.]|nr:hypothetical protein [Desulfobulbus sp.]
MIISGGYASSDGDSATTATGNSVTISGGVIGGNIHGGYAYGADGDVTATGNRVMISGGTVTGDVYDGFTEVGGAGVTNTAMNNTVTIEGTPTFTPTTGLYGGGYASDAPMLGRG